MATPTPLNLEALKETSSYSYILGMYLGDGYINIMPRTERLRIYLDNKYPNIISECKKCLQVCFPLNKVSVYNQAKYKTQGNCSIVVVHNKNLSKIFPQHGIGRKHQRKIQLEPWQEELVQTFPESMLRGLIHSDGCRYQSNGNSKTCSRYLFGNKSKDIREIFQKICHQLDINYTTREGYTDCSGYLVTEIASQVDVKKLDEFIGPKS